MILLASAIKRGASSGGGLSGSSESDVVVYLARKSSNSTWPTAPDEKSRITYRLFTNSHSKKKGIIEVYHLRNKKHAETESLH